MDVLKTIKDIIRKDLSEKHLTEAVTIKKTTHPWGKMMVVHHGSSHSFPLHPEHQEAIAKLKDGEHTSFTDETKSKVTAHRDGDMVHLSMRGSNTKTPVAMSHFKEDVEQVDELKKDTLDSYKWKARADIRKKSSIYGTSAENEKKIENRRKGLTAAYSKLANEEVDLDEAKRGRPRKDGTSKPAGDDEHQEADKNIHTQLHKVISAGKHVTFNSGEKKEISPQHAHKALGMLQNAKASDRLAIQNSLAHSHARFQETLKTGKAVTDAARPKVSLAKSVREDVNPTTIRADRGAIIVRTIRKPDGSYVLSKTSKGRVHTGDIIDSESQNENVELEKTLNSLYDVLSEENKVIFNELVQTEDGIESLVQFAKKQGY